MTELQEWNNLCAAPETMKVTMPIDHTGAVFGGYKVLSAIVAFFSPVIAFFLMLSWLPLDKADPHRDVVRRLLGCGVSSMLVGGPALIYLHEQHAWVMNAAYEVGERFGSGQLGLIWLMGSVLLSAGLPGWILVGAVMRSVAKLDGKDLPGVVRAAREMVDDMTAKKET